MRAKTGTDPQARRRANIFAAFLTDADLFALLAQHAGSAIWKCDLSRPVHDRWPLESRFRFSHPILGRMDAVLHLTESSDPSIASLYACVRGSSGRTTDILCDLQEFVRRPASDRMAGEVGRILEEARDASAARDAARRASSFRFQGVITRSILEEDERTGWKPKGRRGPYPGGHHGWLYTATIGGIARWEPCVADFIDDAHSRGLFRGEMAVCAWRTTGPWNDRELGAMRNLLILTALPLGDVLRLWSITVEDSELAKLGRYNHGFLHLSRLQVVDLLVEAPEPTWHVELLRHAIEVRDREGPGQTAVNPETENGR